MKKKKDRPAEAEMISLNEQFFSLEEGNLTVEELDRRLELAVAAVHTKWICLEFTCGNNSANCVQFSCGTFKAY